MTKTGDVRFLCSPPWVVVLRLRPSDFDIRICFGFRYSDFEILNPQRFDQLILSRDLRAVPLGLEHRNNRAEQEWLEAPATTMANAKIKL